MHDTIDCLFCRRVTLAWLSAKKNRATLILDITMRVGKRKKIGYRTK